MSVTLAQVAARTRVSARAVSYAINGKAGVSDKTREHILAVASEMGYRPNAAARSMRSNRTGHVGVLIRNDDADRLTHLMAFETILGINQGLEREGYVVSLVRLGDVRQGLSSRSRVFEEHVLDGLIVFCEMPDAIDREVQELIPSVVWVESQTWRERGCLRRDELHSGRLCAQRMASLGYRDLVWIGHPGTTKFHTERPGYSGRDRERGVREAAEAAGVRVRRFDLAYDEAETFRRFPAFLASLTPGTAVVAGQAYQARWLRHAAGSLGLNPPYDFGLCCCDDGHDVASVWPGLCRVGFDRYGLGVKAAEMMLRRLSSPAIACPSERVRGGWIPGDTAWGPRPPRPLPPHEAPAASPRPGPSL